MAVSFDQHPMAVLRPQRPVSLLTDRAQQDAALQGPEGSGARADRVHRLVADAELFRLSPREFALRMVDELGPVAWVEGPDFRFGRGREGDVALLAELGEELGFAVEVIPPVEVTLRDKSRAAVSSSLVRWLVHQGRMADVHLCLGRPFALRGEVVAGDRRGREIGFPTANLDTPGRTLPADGVYGGWTELDGRKLAVAASVGTKPTFAPSARVVEAHLLDFDGDVYGRTLEVRLVRWLRDQVTFAGVEALVEQMNRDVAEVRRLYARDLLNAAELAVA